ncbi:MAG: TMEM165/GDT1 family protein [Chromatiaceae bacterium]
MTSVWIGATLGLLAASAVGVMVGRRLLRRILGRRVQQAGGVVFLLLAAFALTGWFDAR